MPPDAAARPARPAPSARTCSGSRSSRAEQIQRDPRHRRAVQGRSASAQIKKVPTLRGMTIVNLFFEASTRTRISFEFAEKRLSADTVNVAVVRARAWRRARRSWTRRATSRRCGSTWSSSGTRPPAPRASSPSASTATSSTPATARTSTPRRALLDILTLRDRLGDLAGRRVCIVGDVLHSRVARSQHLRAAASSAPRSPSAVRARCCPMPSRSWACTVFDRIEAAIEWAEALNMLRLQLERMQAGYIPSLREYNRVFGVTRERLERAPRDLLILHPGPMNRGVEIDSDVADGPHSVILAPGHQRRRRAHGRALPARRRQPRPRRRRQGRERADGARPAAEGRPHRRSLAGPRRRRRRAPARRQGRGVRRLARHPRRRRGDRLRGTRRRPRHDRRARAPARARPRGCGDDQVRCARGRGRWLHRRVRDAEHATRSPTTRPPSASSSGRARRPASRASIRTAPSRVGQKGETLAEFGRDGRGRRRGVQRRRLPGAERAAHAHRARVRAHLRRARGRALRGHDARARRAP